MQGKRNTNIVGLSAICDLYGTITALGLRIKHTKTPNITPYFYESINHTLVTAWLNESI